ncbi:hypothetical protein [uncultured marine virus]|uniref:ATP-dependent helicase Rep n=1 Tax=uncultured marine virus TaxID=186617 RepID=S4TE17_9VIRU|nr:hypothetical protein [uncultured marine virus]
MDDCNITKLRKRGWFLTINNPTEDCKLKSLRYVHKSEYGVIGEETCPTTGTPHYHVYFRLKDAVTFSKIKKDIPRANIEPAKGNDQQCKDYCSKQNLLVEHGTISAGQGKRTDMSKVKDLISEDPRMSSIIEQVGSLQSIRTAEKLLIYKEPKRNWKTEVYWFCGATGTGKSKLAFELHPDAYVAMDTGEWWEGYDAHEEVIIDDMRRDFLKFHQLLKLFDRYPYRVQFKGGSRQFLARTIIVTSCYSPEEMFETREDIQQLLRRLTKIKYF